MGQFWFPGLAFLQATDLVEDVLDGLISLLRLDVLRLDAIRLHVRCALSFDVVEIGLVYGRTGIVIGSGQLQVQMDHFGFVLLQPLLAGGPLDRL
jgi:hypothetical protein